MRVYDETMVAPNDEEVKSIIFLNLDVVECWWGYTISETVQYRDIVIDYYVWAIEL